MQDNRALIIVNSVYQLFTAIHIKQTILRDRPVDMILTDITPRLKECLLRLREAKIFERVIFGSTKELNEKCAKGTVEELSGVFGKINQVFRWVLEEELGFYTEVFFSNFDPFTRMLACRYDSLPCDFICFEDGFSTYVIDFLRENRAAINRHPEGSKIKEKIKKVLLYEPRLAMRGDSLINEPLPKISREDGEFKSAVNYIFDYQRPKEELPFIFLEQSFRAEGIKTNDISLMRECQDAVGTENFVVKPHPRNPENLPFLLGLTRKYQNHVPWELLLLNGDMENSTVITVCSNGALTGRLVFGLDIPTVMLYELFEGKVLWQEDAVLKNYLRKFQRQFAGENYYVPKTVYELKNILKYLGGRNEQ